MSETFKIQLFPARVNPYAFRGPEDHDYLPLRKSLPFFRSGQGTYLHRVRSGKIHIWAGKYSHTSLHLWCGMSGLLSKKHRGSKFLAAPERDDILCATCEGRVIGAGQTDSHKIAGRFVKFSPRLS